MSRYLKTYGDELSNLRVLAGLDNQAGYSKPAAEVGLMNTNNQCHITGGDHEQIYY